MKTAQEYIQANLKLVPRAAVDTAVDTETRLEEMSQRIDRAKARHEKNEDAALYDEDEEAYERWYYAPIVAEHRANSRIGKIEALQLEELNMQNAATTLDIRVESAAEDELVRRRLKALIPTRWQSVFSIQKERIAFGPSNTQTLFGYLDRLVTLDAEQRNVLRDRPDWQSLIFTAPQQRTALHFAKLAKKGQKGTLFSLISEDVAAISRLALPEHEGARVKLHDYCPPLERVKHLEGTLHVHRKTALQRAEQERCRVQVSATKRARDEYGARTGH